MFKEDIKIKILNEEHFKKVKEILVKEDYDFLDIIHWEDKHLFAYSSGWQSSEVKVSTSTYHFDEHQNKEYVLHNNTLVPKEQSDKKILTPCEQLGYKVGDKFIVLETTAGFTKGQTVHLYKDDGTPVPPFKGANTRFALCGEDEPGAFLSLDYVKPFKESNTNQEEKKMTEVNQQKATNKQPKNKPKTKAQLVFTYANGKKYIVRGLQSVKMNLMNGVSSVEYVHETSTPVKKQKSTVVVRVTNELVKVEKINQDNSVEVILDLSSAAAQHAVEGSKKARGHARSKEQWEAMLKDKKAQEERNKALVEATAKQLAEKMLKEGKI